MYMILWWKNNDDYLSHVCNLDGSIRLFETLQEADEFADKQKESHNMRVIKTDAIM